MARFIAAFITTLTLLGAPVALASPPTHPTHPTTPATSRTDPAKPTVTYVLRGTLTGYTAATTSTNGSITINVTSSNFEGKALTGTALTFPVTTKTRIVLHRLATITAGDRGIVKVRAPKGTGATTLQTSSALQVIDQASRGKGHGADPTDPAKPTVMFVLRGTLTGYTAATTSTNGSITINVTSSNFEGKALTGTALTFPVTTKTRIVLHHLATITAGDRGIVKVRAPKGTGATALQAIPAFQVIDQASRE